MVLCGRLSAFEHTLIYTVNRKKHTKMFCHTFHKTPSHYFVKLKIRAFLWKF